MAELRSCNRGFHHVGIDSLFAILLPRAPSLPSRLSLLVFPKIRFKGVYPAGCEKKKKTRAGWSSHLVKAFWTAKRKKKKKRKQNCYLLLPLTLSVRIHTFPIFVNEKEDRTDNDSLFFSLSLSLFVTF